MKHSLQMASASLSKLGIKHVVVSADVSEAENFLDLAVPNDYKLWMQEIPKLLRGLDPKATDANIKASITYAIKKELPRLQRENGTKLKFTSQDFEGFFRDRMDEVREVFDHVQGRRH